jgi:tetratricopeptide (TPR) repeat protein
MTPCFATSSPTWAPPFRILKLQIEAGAVQMRCWVFTWCLVVAPLTAAAQPPGPAQVDPPSVVPEKPPAPNLPPPDDGGPNRFAYSTDQAIAHFRQLVKAEPENARAHRYLGEFLERKAREVGDESLFQPAEEHLRQALALQPEYPQAKTSLAAVLCARHRFAEALKLTQEVLKSRPRDVDVLTIQGDALLELGRYAEAEAVYQRLEAQSPIPEVLARLANLAEFKGELAKAEELMRRAASLAAETGGANADAWYRGRLGDLALEAGRLDDAAAIYQAIPDTVDAYHDATAGLARIRAAQGKNDEAIALYRRAIAIGPDSSMLIGLGDLYVALGKPELAEPLFALVVQSSSGVDEHRRTLAMFYADHGRELTTALELARLDYAERKDIYAADTLAWALYQNRIYPEAEKMMAEALRLGTKDAKLQFHAGMIQFRLENLEAARPLLNAAVSHPAFSIRDAKIAREFLARLPPLTPLPR